MSYNISSWKTKKLNNLQIPVEEFFTHERIDWRPVFNKDESGKDVINNKFNDCGGIKGEIKDGVFFVEKIDLSGEGSGTFFEWILEPALEKSSGELEAILIWEGGDSVSRLVVTDGDYNHEDIEL